MKAVRSFAIAMLFGATLSGAAAAQDTKKPAVEQTIYGDWSVRCIAGDANAKRCIMTQILTSGGEQSQVLRVELNPAADGAAQGYMVLPFGVDVNKGISLSIDGGARFNLAYRTCRKFGCVVPTSFSAGAVKAMQKGSQIAVTVYTIDDNSSFDIPVSLKGFTAAFSALNS